MYLVSKRIGLLNFFRLEEHALSSGFLNAGGADASLEPFECSHQISNSSLFNSALVGRWSKVWLSTAVLLGVIALCGTLWAADAGARRTAKPSYQYTGNISLDLSRVPFSRFGSYMAFSMLTDTNPERSMVGLYAPNGTPGLYLRNLHDGVGANGVHPVFRIDLLKNGSRVAFDVEATPTLLRLKAPSGDAKIYFDAADRIRFRTHGLSLRLTPVDPEVTVPKENSHWEIFREGDATEKYTIWARFGSLNLLGTRNGTGRDDSVAVFNPDPATDISEGEIVTYDRVWTPTLENTSFDSGLRSVRNEYLAWLKQMPQVSPQFGQGAELSAYVNWSSVVAPKGFLDRPTMLMSKNWMTKVWAWDHCFNAMALSIRDPDFAWQQFMIMFDNQLPSGALPDTVRETARETKYSKPPIHGWALMWMIAHGGYSDRKHLAEVYEPLERWTEWYFHDRDQNHDGLPEYNSGPDSGWDNSTVFLSGAPVETPELSSYLVLQMDALSKMAHELGKEEQSRAWAAKSDQLLHKMLQLLWRKDHFIAIRADNDADVDTDSLELYMPLILGKKLPIAVRDKMIEGLLRKGRFRTDHGFASEALTSSHYVPDGYWLGPIWAPNSMLLAEGLDSIGQKDIAEKLRLDFCKMVQQNGISENFDAISGSGLRDPAYTWTSSVYLIFAHQLWERY